MKLSFTFLIEAAMYVQYIGLKREKGKSWLALIDIADLMMSTDTEK